MSEMKELPVLPMRELALLPGVTTPIQAGRPGTLRAIQEAVDRPERAVFAVAQLEDTDQVDPERLNRLGTIATIGQLQRMNGGVSLLLDGEMRAVAVRFERRDGYLTALVREVEDILPPDPDDAAFLALIREVRQRAGQLGELAGLAEPIVHRVLDSVEEPGRLADVVANYVDLAPDERQALLEQLEVEDRLRAVLMHVERQISVLEAQQEIQSKVAQELGDRQREVILREQLKAIQQELGEGDRADELTELKARLDALELPDDVRREVDRELDRLTRMGRDAMEGQVIRTYLETIAELPWSARTEDQLDLEQAWGILEEDHYGLGDVKDRVLEFLAVRQLAEGSEESTQRRAPILLFAGPPGVGKTSIAQSIARAMGREYVRVSLGGARDEADIRGHRRTYVGAMPGRIIAGMRQAGSRNPVFLLDEVDKLGVSFQGDPASALLEVLDPAQNGTFVDHYLGVPFDLSEVLFIATANFIGNIPGPLLDRMEVVEFRGYTEAEKLEIARRFLLPEQRAESALAEDQLEVTDDAVGRVITYYTREAGVRQLQQQLGKLGRKVARKIAIGESASVTVDSVDVTDYLGRPRVHPERVSAEDQIGVATGMYYTPVGGDIMFVEAITMRGRGELVLTGQLGDVMKESARAAWSYARSHAKALGIDDDRFDRDIHVHVPAGAIPKDGPSAGVTMATAMVSALSGHPVARDIAMTGEITLTGRVLPVGGIKEKVLGAVRAGISRIVLPRENEADTEELPLIVRDSLDVTFVRDLGDVLALAIPGQPASVTPDPVTRPSTQRVGNGSS